MPSPYSAVWKITVSQLIRLLPSRNNKNYSQNRLLPYTNAVADHNSILNENFPICCHDMQTMLVNHLDSCETFLRQRNSAMIIPQIYVWVLVQAQQISLYLRHY